MHIHSVHSAQIRNLNLSTFWSGTLLTHISGTLHAHFNTVSLKKKTFCFIVDDNYPWPPKMLDIGVAKTKLTKFKNQVSRALVCDYFSSPEELGLKIAGCIGKCLGQIVPKAIERNLIVRVHTAYFTINPALYYFINATNLSENRTLEITHVWYEDESTHIAILNRSRSLPVRLQIEQSWETWIAVERIPIVHQNNAFERFRVRISSGDVYQSQANPDVPLEGTVPGGPIYRL